MNKQEIENQVKEDYKKVLGKSATISVVMGYRGYDSIDVICDPPARCRVVETREVDLMSWCDDWCDPYWDIELLEPHPSLEGMTSLWVFGTSYEEGTGQVDPTKLKLEVET